MSYVRILSCGTNLENFKLCISEQVAGFRIRFHSGGTGDTVYLVVKIDNKIYCGARGVLGELTDYKPWPDAANYKDAYRFRKFECCDLFELVPLIRQAGISNAGLVLQSPKPVQDETLRTLLDQTFSSRSLPDGQIPQLLADEPSDDDSIAPDDTDDVRYVLDVSAAYQIVPFISETHEEWGLEKLVSEHFFELFPSFTPENNFLISDHRLFQTAGTRNQNNQEITGIRGVPDALLITFEPDNRDAALRINLIEYECNGTIHCTPAKKEAHLNEHIIPQMIRFASAFSATTEQNMRNSTIQQWRDKIIGYVDQNPSVRDQVDHWIERLNPNISQWNRSFQFQKELEKAFASNVKIMLIIDELSEERSTLISSLVKTFRLPGHNSRAVSVGYDSYVVQLIERSDPATSTVRRSLAARKL